VTIQISEGEFVGIIGPNGSGKTTCLKAILGLIAPSAGSLHVFDCACEKLRCEHRAKIGYLPQKDRVEPDYPITNFEVVMMGRYGALGLFNRPSKKDREIAMESLRAVGMERFHNQPFGSLSGGQQRRVLIARAITQQPKILLLDEPTTGLDTTTQGHLLDLIQSLHQGFQLTIVFVTHDINLISPVCNTLLILKTKVYGKGPPVQVLTQDILTQVYGKELILVERENRPYVIFNDTHHTG